MLGKLLHGNMNVSRILRYEIYHLLQMILNRVVAVNSTYCYNRIVPNVYSEDLLARIEKNSVLCVVAPKLHF